MSNFAVLQRWAKKALENLSLAYSLWPLIPASLVAFASGWLARGVAAFGSYGALAWISVGILAFLTVALGFLAIGIARNKMVHANAVERWARKIDSVNPMLNVYDNQRILINDLAHPISRRISNKNFNNCDMIGHSVITFIGHGLATGVLFKNCDIIIARDGVNINNIVIF